MKKLFECELEYVPNYHLMQIYAGFFELEKLGIIDLKLKPIKKPQPSIISAIINKKYKAIYDTDDGLTWIIGDEITNLEHFQKTFKADFYFKRSYDPRMQGYKPANCQIFPLGLNYNVHPDKNLLFYNDSFKDKVKYFVKTNTVLKNISKKKFFYEKDFEYYPIKTKENRILFLTRLWDPEEALTEEAKEFRAYLNSIRIKCIETCKKEFGDLFTGGLFMEPFAKKNFPSLVSPKSFTNKASYLQSVKDHTICIATTGLHNSIGWKLGEYVAASRAIVTEPLKFVLPGNFDRGRNYYEFETSDQLLEKIEFLNSNPGKVMDLMKNNYHYYNNFVKPKNLILNTLLTIANNAYIMDKQIPRPVGQETMK
ncbi:MAG: hypothetical protein ACXWCZ_04700 [Flavisolibacter sp.]